MGSLVADAATMGLHWIYQTDKVGPGLMHSDTQGLVLCTLAPSGPERTPRECRAWRRGSATVPSGRTHQDQPASTRRASLVSARSHPLPTRQIQELLKSKGREAAPEFFEPPSCPFYKVRRLSGERLAAAGALHGRSAACAAHTAGHAGDGALPAGAPGLSPLRPLVPPGARPCAQMPSGSLSPYGAEVAALLQYMDGAGAGGIQGGAWAKALAKYFVDVYAGARRRVHAGGPAACNDM